jgi:predicted patatin/cPLA2 family phospholipase
MQRASTTSTKPFLSLRIALTGQALMQGGFSHCLQVIATSVTGSDLTTRMRDAFVLNNRS